MGVSPTRSWTSSRAGRTGLRSHAVRAGLDSFYESLSGGEFLDALRGYETRLSTTYSSTARTGLANRDICTLHLPDVLVDCFTLSTQGIEGAAKVAQLVRQRQMQVNRRIRVLPRCRCASTGPKRRKRTPAAWVAMRTSPVAWKMTEVSGGSTGPRSRCHTGFLRYEETLAVFGDPPRVELACSASFERLAGYVTAGA